jgi:hypothetical protein
MAKPQTPKPPRYRSATRYKRSETSRLLQSAKDAGLQVTGLEVDPATGVLRVLVGNDGSSSPPLEGGDAK